MRRWQLNAPLAVRTVIVLALGWAALHLWHERVVRINAGALLNRAKDQETNEDWQGAAQSFRRYLSLRPHDASARVRLAQAFDRAAAGAADKFKSLALFAAAVAAAPDDLEVRRRHLALTVELEDYAAALQYADLLLQLQPDDPIALKYKALALYARWNIRQETSLVEVQAAFEAANRADPADPAAAARLARLYRTQSREPKSAERADSVMDKLVEASDGSVDALLTRHAYRKEFGLEGADADLDRALAIVDSRPPVPAPDGSPRRDPALFLAAGLRAMARDEAAAAENYFERAIAAAPNGPRSYLLLGQAHRKQGDPRAALGVLLRGLEKAGSTNFPLQVETAAVEIELGELDSAEKSLAAMERQTDYLSGRQQTESLAMIAALRADLLLRRRDYVAAIPALKRILSLRRGGASDDRKSAADADVQMQIGTCYSLLGQWDQAAAAHQAAADLQPRRQHIRLAAAQAWEHAGWLDEAVRQYEEALAIERPPPQAWEALATARFCQQASLPRGKRDWTAFQQALASALAATGDSASLQLLQAEYELASGHGELAAEILSAVESQVADVPVLAVRLAQAYERLGRPEDADRIAERLATEEAALPGALLQCELLLNRGRGDEAEQALVSVGERLPAGDRHALQYRRALVMLAGGKVDDARDLLERLAGDRPDDPKPLQVLAELALEGHDLARAQRHEQQLQRLERIAGQTGWRFYRAQRLIGEALQTDDRPSRQKLLDEARSLQSQLERLRPYWAPTHLLKARLAQLETRPDDETAILAYFTALRLGERRVQVYQELISLLFRQHRIAEAAGLIDRLRGGEHVPGKVVSLAVAADVSQALQLLETLVEHDDAPIDRLLLARLYEARNQMGKAREQLDSLVGHEKPDPAHLAAYADHLLRMSDGPLADPRRLAQLLDQLATLEPENRSFRTLALRVRWLKHEEREGEIVSLVDAFVGPPPTDSDRSRFTQRMLLVAGLCDNLQLESEAEACYRRAAKLSAQAYRPLAVWLARHKRTAEAIELCRGPAERDDSPAAAIAMAAVLALGPATADDHRAAGPILEQALAKHPDDASLLLALGTLRMVQDDDDEAERLFRRVLRSEPRHVVALNNLAMLLAEQASRQKEALALVDRAISVAGAQAELLDTKGWIFLEQRQLALAETSFHEALALSADSPRYRFHLALAYQRQGKNEDARRALDRAADHKLAAELLSPREQHELRKLESQLN